MGKYVSSAKTGKYPRNPARAGSRSAGKRNSTAALPCSHYYFARTQYVYKVGVYSLREQLVVFYFRADLFQVQFVYVRLAEKYRVEMPITQAVYQVLFEGLDPIEAIGQLMSRPPKDEDVGKAGA